MNIPAIIAIFRKELTDFIRDRRTLFSLFVLPLIITPALMIGMSYFITKSQREAREKQLKVAIVEREPAGAIRNALLSGGIALIESTDPRAAVEKKNADAGIEAGSVVRIYTDNSKPQGGMIASRIRQLLDAEKQRVVSQSLQKYNVPESVLQPFRTELVNVAPPKKMGGMFLGSMVGFVLVIFMLSAGMYPAMDMTAGEKERRTIEMLLVSPVTRAEIVAGKMVAILCAILTSALLSIASFAGTFAYLRQSGSDLARLSDIPLDGAIVALIAIALLGYAFFSSALILAIAAAAKSVREATSYVTPIMFVAMFAGYAVITPGVNLPAASWAIPFANFIKIAKDLLMGEWAWSAFLLTLAANLVYAAIAFCAALYCFRNERIVLKT